MDIYESIQETKHAVDENKKEEQKEKKLKRFEDICQRVNEHLYYERLKRVKDNATITDVWSDVKSTKVDILDKLEKLSAEVKHLKEANEEHGKGKGRTLRSR